jgi:hypothetical protein
LFSHFWDKKCIRCGEEFVAENALKEIDFFDALFDKKTLIMIGAESGTFENREGKMPT